MNNEHNRNLKKNRNSQKPLNHYELSPVKFEHTEFEFVEAASPFNARNVKPSVYNNTKEEN